MVKFKQKQVEDTGHDLRGSGDEAEVISLTGSSGLIDCNGARIYDLIGNTLIQQSSVPGGIPSVGNYTLWVKTDGYAYLTDSYGTNILLGSRAVSYDGYITLTATGVAIGLGTELLDTSDGYVIINDSTGATLLTMDNVLRSEKQILINNSVPLANPPAGMGYLYSDSGAGKWRSPSGTITTFGTADPHCPKCGRDFALEYENNDEILSICMSCFADVFRSFIIRDTRRKQ